MTSSTMFLVPQKLNKDGIIPNIFMFRLNQGTRHRFIIIDAHKKRQIDG